MKIKLWLKLHWLIYKNSDNIMDSFTDDETKIIEKYFKKTIDKFEDKMLKAGHKMYNNKFARNISMNNYGDIKVLEEVEKLYQEKFGKGKS